MKTSNHWLGIEPVKRIRNELKEAGIDLDSNTDLTTQELPPLQCCYQEDQVSQILMKHLDRMFGPSVPLSVLQVGGCGSRNLAKHRPKTDVVSLELDPFTSKLSASLTVRLGDSNIRHLTGSMDELDTLLSGEKNHLHAVSCQLSMLHVNTNLTQVLKQIHQHLRPDGILFICDYWAYSNLSGDRQATLKEAFGGIPPSNMAWCDLLSQVGFGLVEFDDVTEHLWHPWIRQQIKLYDKDREERVHGKQDAQNMWKYLNAVEDLFQQETAKGCLILAQKVPDNDSC